MKLKLSLLMIILTMLSSMSFCINSMTTKLLLLSVPPVHENFLYYQKNKKSLTIVSSYNAILNHNSYSVYT